MPYGLDKKYFADNFVNNRIWYTAMFIYSYDEMNLCYFFFFSTPCQFSSFPQLLHSIPLLCYIYHLAINTVLNFYFSSFSVTVAATLFSLGFFR